MTNEQLYDAAKDAIDKLFNDTSVSLDVCRQNMETLKDELEILIDSLSDQGDTEF